MVKTRLLASLNLLYRANNHERSDADRQKTISHNRQHTAGKEQAQRPEERLSQDMQKFSQN